MLKSAATDLLRNWKCLAVVLLVYNHDDATRLFAGVVTRVHTLVLVHRASELDRAFG